MDVAILYLIVIFVKFAFNGFAYDPEYWLEALFLTIGLKIFFVIYDYVKYRKRKKQEQQENNNNQ